MNRMTTATALTIPLISLCACTVVSDFDRPLEIPDFRDADTEVDWVCDSDDDCSALGACIVCSAGVCSESALADQDGDGWLNPDCEGINKGDDCNDLDAGVHPGAEERCNGDDDNCDGVVDEGDAFGLSWIAEKEGGRSSSISAVSGTIGIAWVEGLSHCPTVRSGFVSDDGVVRYPYTLSECGEDVWLSRRGTGDGYTAVFVDRSEGGADIYLNILDPLGQPIASQPDPVNITEDFEESDSPVLSWHAPAFLYGTAWLSHDTDDRDLVTVLFQILDPSGEPILEEPVELTTGPFSLTDEIESGFGERLDLASYEIDGSYGFGAVWTQPDGIWFASIELNAEGTDVQSVTGRDLSAAFPTGGGLLPSLAWADDRFVIAYSRVDPASGKTTPDVFLAQVHAIPGSDPVVTPVQLPLEFPREATYPSLVWHEDLEEIGLAWADGRQGYGLREVRFSRLKISDGDGVTIAGPVLPDIVLTDPGAYAGGIVLDAERGGGFVVSWTERSGSEVGLAVGYLECRQ